jgi:hypothetical protein
MKTEVAGNFVFPCMVHLFCSSFEYLQQDLLQLLRSDSWADAAVILQVFLKASKYITPYIPVDSVSDAVKKKKVW